MPKRRKQMRGENLTIQGRARRSSATTTAADRTTIAANALAQTRRFARNPSTDIPTDPHTVSSSGVLVRLNLPQSCGGGTLRPRPKASATSASARACSKRLEHISSDSGSDTSSDKTTRKRRKQVTSKNEGTVLKKRLTFSYPNADEMFRVVERELGLGEQEPFYPSSGWCRPPPEHPDLAAWLLEHTLDADESQQERRVKEDSRRAAEFRVALETAAPTKVCAVCSCMVCPAKCQSLPLASIPGLEVLRADLPPTDEVPRSGHTTYQHDGIKYLLQPNAISTKFGTVMAQICTDCMTPLSRHEAKVPKASLAAIDPGMAPATLPNLTIMESIIIAPTRLICHVLTLTPGRRQESHPERTEDSEGHKVEWTAASTGHTVTFRNPGPDAFVRTFPMALADIPNIFKVKLMRVRQYCTHVCRG